MRFYLLLTAFVGLSIALPRYVQAQGDLPKSSTNTTSDRASEKISTVVEEMPRFPGCEQGSIPAAERNYCAEGKLIEYISQNINYPDEARQNDIQGVVVVGFTVNKKGKLRGIELLRDPGAGLGEEGLRIVRKMAKEKTWIPGRQKNKPVAVKFTLPIRFSLGDSQGLPGGNFDPSKAGTLPPPPPPLEGDIDGSTEVDQMPRFPGCEQKNISDEAKHTCSLEKLLEYVGDNISYPDSARSNNVEGLALVSFVISQEGKMEEIRLLKDPGADLGEEAMRITNKMAEEKIWRPGYQGEQPVRVRFTLPIRFRLR